MVQLQGVGTREQKLPCRARVWGLLVGLRCQASEKTLEWKPLFNNSSYMLGLLQGSNPPFPEKNRQEYCKSCPRKLR